MGKTKEVVREEEWGKIVVMDTAAQIGPEETGQVVVMGSHGAESAARHVARFIPFGVILNDAGKGKAGCRNIGTVGPRINGHPGCDSGLHDRPHRRRI